MSVCVGYHRNKSRHGCMKMHLGMRVHRQDLFLFLKSDI